MEDVEFPEGPPARPPQFVSETTRKQRVVETIICDGSVFAVGLYDHGDAASLLLDAASNGRTATLLLLFLGGDGGPEFARNSARGVGQTPCTTAGQRDLRHQRGAKAQEKDESGGNEFSGLRPT